jgi:glycosyltransferase involved in cell wall biosynthesis
MEKRPLISVLIPTYNRAHYIREAIDSILAQEYDNLEIIVVDDGSTDDTPNVVQRIVGALRATPLRNRNPIKYFYQPNAGISAARNACLAHASGEYIAWCDSDDYWLAGKLQAQVEYMRKNPECEIVFTKYENFVIDEAMKEVAEVSHEFEYENQWITHFTTALVKKEVFEKVGNFREDLIKGEDTDWLFRLNTFSSVNATHLIEKVFYFRRLHGNNITFDTSVPKIKMTGKYVMQTLRNRIKTPIQ